MIWNDFAFALSASSNFSHLAVTKIVKKCDDSKFKNSADNQICCCKAIFLNNKNKKRCFQY
ncbi:hypothetical protein BpHYR1_000401 [Brachionus plicatilis]|uniref:Uncharacterized protein n=1 Tax=Brachionus plicatilis TaxID=10195 RepID=A0A3M7Q5E8_BRAPC|nr:hypothetical protein BpHYR1_000401 [Brachionus plicatilis]